MAHSEPTWWDRYSRRIEATRLPNKKELWRRWVDQALHDGDRLLAAPTGSAAPAWLADVPAVQVLRQVWQEQFLTCPEGGRRWREAGELTPSPLASPYDAEARYSTKRSVEWGAIRCI